ncbi:hypothetical protein CJO94_05895 [Ralstonia solanacearum]|nr:hypothetical protein CJO94_05895 [Ralstonia solanacearum]
MPNLEQSITADPRDDALLRLAELDVAINAAAKLLTPADTRAIWQELNTVARTLKRVSYGKPSHRPAIAPPTAPTQGDLLG